MKSQICPIFKGLYEISAFYWTATAISTRKYPVPFDPGSQAGKSPPSTAVREKEYRQWRSRWRYSQLDFQHRTGPPPIRISLFANQSRLKSKTFPSPRRESRGAVVFWGRFRTYFCRFFIFVVKSQENWLVLELTYLHLKLAINP